MIARAFRWCLWFAVGVLLAAVWLVPQHAAAETIAATVSPSQATVEYGSPIYGWHGSSGSACSIAKGSEPWTNSGGQFREWFVYRCNYTHTTLGFATFKDIEYRFVCPQAGQTWTQGQLGSATCTPGGSYSCPTGQNWTLSGANCTRPDCSSGQVRDATNGLCVATCQVPENDEVGFGAATTIPSGYKGCMNGCQVYPGGSTYTHPDGTRVRGYYSYGTPCTGQTTPLTEQTADDSCYGKGMCPGTVNGASVCFPCKSTENTSSTKTTTPASGGNPEKVTTTTKTEVCTGTGSCTTTTSISTSTGGGAPVAGPSTTSTQAGGKAAGAARADGQGGFDLDLPDDYAREDTALRIRDASEKVAKVLDLAGAADTATVDQADADTASKQARTDAEKSVTDLIDGTVDPATASKSLWQQAMSGGFLAPVVPVACQPLSAQVGTWTWTFDHCTVAARIAEIMGYALWFWLAVGSFVFLTGGRAAGVK